MLSSNVSSKKRKKQHKKYPSTIKKIKIGISNNALLDQLSSKIEPTKKQKKQTKAIVKAIEQDNLKKTAAIEKAKRLAQPVTVEFVDGACGSGKTHSAIDWAVARARCENVCFVQPSKELIRQTKDNLEKKGSNPVSIDSSDSETYGPVQMRLEKFLHRVTPVKKTKKEHFIDIANEKKRKQWPQSPEQLMEIEKDCNILLITHEAFKGCPSFSRATKASKTDWALGSV